MDDNKWLDEYKVILEKSKQETKREMEDLREQIANGYYSQDQLDFIKSFVLIMIKSSFKEITQALDHVENDDIESLEFIYDFTQHLKNIEVELNELLGE